MPVRRRNSSRCSRRIFCTPPPTTPQPSKQTPMLFSAMTGECIGELSGMKAAGLTLVYPIRTIPLRMFAIVSDIHGNFEALGTVFSEIDKRGIEHVICLGDIVGYGPNPMECLDLVRARCRAALMGNHDFAVFYEPYKFNSGAESACFRTRSVFESDPDPVRRAERWRFVGNLPVRVKTNDFVAVHASPRRPINEYIFPDDIYTNPGKFVSIFERFDKLCFVGHTHVPGVFLEGPDFYSPDELDYKFELSDEKAI